MLRGLLIRDLVERQEWLDIVANWHHQEWLKGRTNASDLQAQRSFGKRVAVLREHFQHEPIPTTFVAELNNEPIGSASLVFYQFTEHHRRTEWLTNVFVIPEHRKQGIGQALVNHVCDYAVANSVKELMLYTRDHSIYYQQLGWQAAGTGLVQGRNVAILSKRL